MANFFKNLFFGGETAAPTPQATPIYQTPEDPEHLRKLREKQMGIIGEYEKQYNEDPAQQAQEMANAEAKSLTTSLSDTRKKLQTLMAQRGIKNSSVGIGQQLALEKQGAEQLQDIKLSIPEKIRQLKAERLGQYSNAVYGGLNQLKPDVALTQKGKTQGMLPMLLAGVGTYYGGPGGGMAGYGLGQSITSNAG